LFLDYLRNSYSTSSYMVALYKPAAIQLPACYEANLSLYQIDIHKLTLIKTLVLYPPTQ